ncbi:LysR family transcriptional regulator [Acuticoccus sp.]|uniref:LysR family transcriptional regulator n=1 Tax=Acuticoccus sp. TaxID=1904378 RepID=UPI003B53017D
MRLNPHQFAAFAHAAREGSFSRAAARLGLSQSAVSQHVASLERTIGASLLVRSRSGLTLTPAGRDFFELADRYATLDQLIGEKVEGYRTLGRGHLNVIANAPRPALELLAAYKRANPNVEVSFTLFDWTSAMRLLRERQVDVGIVTEPSAMKDCIVAEIGRARYVAYVPVDHPMATRRSVSVTDLKRETVLLPEEGSFTQRIVSRKLSKLGERFDNVIRTTTFPLMKEAVLHGVGIGIFLSDAMHPSTRITTLAIDELPESYATCLVAPADKARIFAVRAFLDVAFARERPVAPA